MCHAVAGVYLWVSFFAQKIPTLMLTCLIVSWDFATSLDFEWGYITRKRNFRWPMVFASAQRRGSPVLTAVIDLLLPESLCDVDQHHWTVSIINALLSGCC